MKNKSVVKILISNRPEAGCVERIKKLGIPTTVFSSKNFSGSREEYDKFLVKELKKYNVDLVCLAGYMRLVSSYFLQQFPPHHVLNIHPAILPSFPGTNAWKDALDHGVKISGCTIHFVDEKMDHGPIIIQKQCNVTFDDTEDSLKEKILRLEHQAYPEAIELFCDEKLEVVDRKIKITN